ncbi:MAG: alpha/beta fold hydrolase [Candidatus Geothermincolia bacterium]
MKDLRLLENETFDGTWPFAPRYREVQGFRMHYVEEGQGDPLVLLHALPLWGYSYRRLIPELARAYRVIVPDHMGFGKSELSRDRPYRLSQHIHNLIELLAGLATERVTLVMHAWSAPIGMGYATHYPERVARLVFMNAALGVLPPGARLWVAEMEERGYFENMMGDLGSQMHLLLKAAMARPEMLTETTIAAYSAPFPDPESCAAAVAFQRDIPIGATHPSAGTMNDIIRKMPQLRDKPMLLIWGMRDLILGERFRRAWIKRFSHIKTTEIERAGHFLTEDAPEEVLEALRGFLP